MSEKIAGVSTRYYGPTNHRSSRIRVQWGSDRVTVSYDHSASGSAHVAAVHEAMEKWGKVVGSVEYVTDTESGRGSVYRVTFTD